MGCCPSKMYDTDICVRPVPMPNTIFPQKPFDGKAVGQTADQIGMMNCAVSCCGTELEYLRLREKNIISHRAELEEMLKKYFSKCATWVKSRMNLVEQQQIYVETEPGVKILVYITKPKSRAEKAPAFIWCHGGGAVAGTAKVYEPELIKLAMDLNCMVFNVEYRLSPETKARGQCVDMLEVLNHVYDNASEYGVDQERICLSGESGGALPVTGAAYMMATNGTSHKCKLLFIRCPNLSNQMGRFKNNELNSYEKLLQNFMTDHYRLRANDYEKEHEANDPFLYPGLMPDEALLNLPPVVIGTSEFDFLRRDALHFIERLRPTGRLLDFIDQPGCGHGYEIFWGDDGKAQALENTKLMWQKYVLE